MRVKIIEGDITEFAGDAIVNAANATLLGGSGVDGAIHAAAGPRLLTECRGIGWCSPGDAKITGGYDLPAKHVIHTVGPIWYGGMRGEEQTLISAYRRSCELALAHGLKSIAFPLISAGAYGYPKADAIRIALTTLEEYADRLDITLMLFGNVTFDLAKQIAAELE